MGIWLGRLMGGGAGMCKGGTGMWGLSVSHTQAALSSSAHLCGCLPSVSIPQPSPMFPGALQGLHEGCAGEGGTKRGWRAGWGPVRGASHELPALARPLSKC